ncbi:3-hydroxyacyl-CoA dehydrogenase NAD-binding domain-containing protein [Nocardia africana]|uniref:3-hydroxyacyl-CoA dehydrogenase NAD-binding domain-containing protein n=1 Tax=Nocardia africana TaxID=134964 RepID=A0ABW6NWB7_9NOCA
MKSVRRPSTVGLLGGGVIGGGWAARFVLNGIDVQLYDPAPHAIDRVQDIVTSARRAYQRLTMASLPGEGKLTLVNSVADAVAGAELVQESAPERLELKQQLLTEAGRAASPETLICSSTSGLLPSLLQQGVEHPERLLVAHPFNPVYLLPLVELCAGQKTDPESLTRAAQIYRAVGMHPLVVRKEVDGFIANRLQEAMWREALWLVHDEVATPQDVDDAVRYSFGLRRAVIGPFTIAGGGAGIRRVMEQFGPEVTTTGTKFTDVPEVTDTFLDRLAEQSGGQVANLTVTEFEHQRDDCLVGVLQGLRAQGYGAGETLARWENGLGDNRPQHASDSGPLRTPPRLIPPDWHDANGHVNESRYLQLFSNATGTVERYIGLDGDYRANVGTFYTVETHLFHLGELHAGDRVEVSTQILGADDKRLHLFHVLVREGDQEPMATGEQMLIHIDAASRRSGAMQGTVRERVVELAQLHAQLPRPKRAGASIGLR